MLAIFLIIILGSLTSTASSQVTFKNVTAVCDLFRGWLPVPIASSNNLKSNLPRKERVFKISFMDGDQIPILYKNSIKNLKFLQRLDLTNHQIQSIMPGALKDLPNLKTLLLDGNYLEKLDRGVFNKLTNLTQISLEGNLIKKIAARAFDGLYKLRVLKLRDNNLKKFYPRWYAKKFELQSVELQNNAIYKIPMGAFQHYSKAIFLDGNRIRNISRDIFGTGNEIFRLSLGGNRIEIWDENLLKNIKITFFDISYNRLHCLSRNLTNFFVARLTYIDGNPWTCDSLLHISEWLSVQKSDVHVQMRSSAQKCGLPNF